MGIQKLVVVLTMVLLVQACKEGPVTDTQPACSRDMQQAWQEYDDLMGDDDPNNDPSEPPRECQLPTANPDSNLVVNANLRDFNTEDEAKMREALARMEIVVNSIEFKEKVINFEWNGQRQFNDNDGLTNEEIYQKLMSGYEDLLPVEDSEIDLDLTLYYRNNSTVGYTYPDTVRVWVNNKFFAGYNYGQVAANAIHEWTHKVGFGHDFNNNSDRPFSVPYGIGSIVKEMVNEL